MRTHLIALLVPCLLHAAETSANPVGLAVLVTPVAPDRAVALARAGWTVQALADEPGCQRLRRAGEAAGVLGRSLWVGRWTGSIPIADETADLVEGPDGIAAEVRRVLIPGLGAGNIGSAILRVPRPATWDEWSHWFHGSDNNPVSTDTAFSLPARIAWLGRPFHVDRSAAGRVAADGRLYLAIGVNDLPGRRNKPGNCELTARSLHNGTQLWRRALPPGVRTGRSSMIARCGELLLLEAGAVVRLAGATGSELGRFDVATGRELKWMGYSAGVLVLLAGAPDAPSAGLFGDVMTKGKDLAEGRLGHGDEIICVDPDNGAVRWRSRSPGPIDSRAIAISGGTLIYHAPRSRIAALDLATGSERWVQADAQVLAFAGGGRKDINMGTGLESRPGLVANGTIVLLALPDVKRMMALSQVDGRKLWQTDCGSGVAPSELILGNRVFSTEGGGFLDALTGTKTVSPFLPYGCGVITATGSLILSNSGGPVFDHAANTALPLMPLKTQCQVGGFVANGRMVYIAASCLCPVLLGHCALAPAAGPLPDATGTERLAVGTPGIDASAASTAGDWPTHRCDVRRSGFADVRIPVLRHRWQVQPAHPFPITHRGVYADDLGRDQYSDETEWRCLPPVSLGDLVVVAASDGSVRAFNASSGEPRWTHWCEGPVQASPTIAGGRVYVGSADGSITCLAAVDGTMRWRFRAAPAERRIPVYGLLQSPWPVNSGVLVDGATVYAVAGMPGSPPATAYALDSSTGAVRWAQRGDWSPSGGLAVIGKRLWIRCFHKPGPAVRLSLTDGVRDPDAIEINGMRGRDVAQVAPDLVLYGGADVYRDVGNRWASRSEGLAMVPLDDDGRPRLPGLQAMLSSLVAPAGDGDLVVVAGGQDVRAPCGGGGDDDLEGWDAMRTHREMDRLTAGIDLSGLPGWRLGQFPGQRSNDHYAQAPQRRWGPLPLTVRALVLAQNAVITVASTKASSTSPQRTWKLMILDRATGATTQEFVLPGEPAADGLCLTRDGGVVVAMRDGGVVAFGKYSSP